LIDLIVSPVSRMIVWRYLKELSGYQWEKDLSSPSWREWLVVKSALTGRRFVWLDPAGSAINGEMTQ
jgi:hypothetical protein